MKKATAFLLIAVLLISLFTGCNGTNPQETTQPATASDSLLVGYGRVDISPTETVTIGDPYWGPPSLTTGVWDPLYATCIAFTDGNNNTILLFQLDLTTIKSDQIIARSSISKKLGIPADQIMITATHTHSAPYVTEDNYNVMEWSKSIKDKMLQAAETAMADRKPAKMYTGSTQCESMNFIRHYILDDGSYAGDNFGNFTGRDIVGHTEDADNTMQLIKFTREGGKDVILVNWQGHPHRSYNRYTTHISSDIVGVMRESVEAQLDCHFAYFSGASGNINSGSRIPGETITKDYIEHGQALAAYAVQASISCTPQQIGKTQITKTEFQATTKAENGTIGLPLYAFSLGDVAFITAPYEMFNSQGVEIKASSPFQTTFVCTYANAHNSYIPDMKALDNYDSYEETQTRFARGTAEELAKTYIAMLGELYKTK